MNDLKWKGLRHELSELCHDLQIPEEKFSFLGIYEWQNVYDKVLSTFIDERYARTNGIHWANTENGFRKDVPKYTALLKDRITIYHMNGWKCSVS